MISIIHPTRSRPEKSFETITKWLDNSGLKDIEIIISVDSDDYEKEKLEKLVTQWASSREVYVFWLEGDNKSAIEAINRGAMATHGNIMIVVSDDTDCPEYWAIDLLEEVKGKTDWILKTRDGIQSWLITMPVMDRAYYNRFGYIYHPSYQHAFVDTHLTCVADLIGRKIVSELLFPHLHPSVTGEKKDELMKRTDATFEDGKRVFVDMLKNNFELKESDIIGRLPNNIYTNMQ
jgi:hypothetical protein